MDSWPPTELVTVRTPKAGPTDALNRPSVTWRAEDVRAVVCVGDTADVAEGNRPDGTEATYTLYLPQGYAPRTLRNCVIVVRGEACRVIGDPRPYTMALNGYRTKVRVRRAEG